MEEAGFKKDETPYLVFACTKCKQFSYMKTVQKTKKCLRCGRTHQVRDILDEGEVVNGMTEAVDTVKRKQNEFTKPEFRSGSDFVVTIQTASRPKSTVKKVQGDDQEIDYTEKFNEMLLELSKLYNRFPKYLIEIMSEDYGIPVIALETQIRSAIKRGTLIKKGDNNLYYSPKAFVS